MRGSIGHILKAARQQRNLVQREVATAVGVSVAAVGQWERNDNEISMSNLRAVSDFLQIDPVAASKGELRFLGEATDLNEVTVVSEPTTRPPFGPKDVQVNGAAFGGDDADFTFNGDIVEYVRRPPGIETVRGVFALYVLSDSMFPRFEQGDLVYCGGRQAMPGDDIVVELHPDPGERAGKGFIKRLEQRTNKMLVCRQFNPDKTVEFMMRDVKAFHRVIPLKELLGF